MKNHNIVKLNLIAEELKNSGFDAKVSNSSSVIISLNRQLSTMEVEMTLLNIFDIEFNCSKVSTNQVKITL